VWPFGTIAGTNFWAVDAMNDPRGFMIGRRLIEAGKSPRARADRRPRHRHERAAEIMRIIAGKHRGTQLADVARATTEAHLRPTSDRVRESLFSMLTHHNVINGARVLEPVRRHGCLGPRGAVARGPRSRVHRERARRAKADHREHQKAAGSR